ncbi:MAG: ThiF family adenylyltransferase [Candidatus Liptonbacteria bacterium]|nr:ThiF family adenylyltransferase [Candidatus Liptonbacteria bacterium]
MTKLEKFEPGKENLESFKSRFAVDEVIDNYASQLEELFLVRNPKYRLDKNYKEEFEKFLKEHLSGKETKDAGSWFYFPWSKKLAHYLSDEMHQELRTARNKNLITKAEQEKFYNFKIGVAGLSVGSHAALTIAMMGGGRTMKLADPDEISGSNLNRIRYDFTEVGKSKCELACRKILQINPYAEIIDYPAGITEENIAEFLAGPPKLDVLVEECDNLEMKVRLRIEAKKLGIPVVMATDNGDNVIIDIERYDLDPNLKIFNGAAGDLTVEEFRNFPPQELPKLASKIAGPEVTVPRMLDSLLEVGKTLYSWPQLGDAATLAGVSLSYVVKKMALGEKIKSGKLEVNLDSVFDPDYFLESAKNERDEKRRGFAGKMGF